MREEYQRELEKLKDRMIKAEVFAKKVPIFKNLILDEKISGEEDYLRFDTHYKSIPLGWGINRGLYKRESTRKVTNYDKNDNYNGYLWVIYINTLTLYDNHNKFGLYKATEPLNLFFFDKINSTFYATDEQIEPLLETLNTWYLEVMSTIGEFRRQENIKSLREKLKKLETINEV